MSVRLVDGEPHAGVASYWTKLAAIDQQMFLEVNTAGEFLFVEERTGMPITDAVAGWLRQPVDSRGLNGRASRSRRAAPA